MKHTVRQRNFRLLKKADNKGLVCLALERARIYTQDYPDSVKGWLIYAESLCSLAHYSEALRAARRALFVCPLNHQNRPFIYLHIGRIHEHNGKPITALLWYRKAVKTQPDDAGHRIYLGGLLASMGRLTEAAKVHRRATRCKRGCIDEAHLNLGLVLRAQRKYKEAIQSFRKALQIDPNYQEAKKELKDVEATIDFLRDTQPVGS